MAVERDFVATCYEVFLGRELDAVEVADRRRGWDMADVLASIIGCDEFDAVVRRPLEDARLPPGHLFRIRFSVRHRLWAADRLPLSSAAAADAMRAADWWDFLRILTGDEALMAAARCPVVRAAPLPSWLVEERVDRRDAERIA